MGSRGKEQIIRIFEQIDVLEEEKGTPLRINDVADEIGTSSDPRMVLELFERKIVAGEMKQGVEKH